MSGGKLVDTLFQWEMITVIAIAIAGIIAIIVSGRGKP